MNINFSHDTTLRLSELPPGGEAVVLHMENDPPMLRRLNDIGLTENTVVRCLGRSPLGDPVAYRIRGAVIALRRADASLVDVRRTE